MPMLRVMLDPLVIRFLRYYSRTARPRSLSSGNSLDNPSCQAYARHTFEAISQPQFSCIAGMMDLSQLQKLRPCGRLETYSTVRHHLGFYNNVGLTAAYTTSSNLNRTLESTVFAALRHVIEKHSNLSAISINEDKSYPEVYFARLPEVDLRTCVEFYNRKTPIPQGDEPDDELDRLLREQHGRNFKGDVQSRPYWRLVIGSSTETPGWFTASWIFHHALSDGSSSMLFHQTFVEGLNAAAKHENMHPVVKSPIHPISPSLEELNPMKLSWSFFLRAIGGSLLPSYFAPRSPTLWTGSPIGAPLQTPAPAHHTTTVFLSAETTKALAIKCREEKTSVTAALSTLLAAVISSSIAPEKDLKIDTPISLRPFLSMPEDQIVNAITNHTFTFSAEAGANATSTSESNVLNHFSWATAREVKNALVNEVEKKGADNPVALLRYVSNMQNFFLEKLGSQRETSAEVSNLGIWRGRTSSPSSDDANINAMKLKEQWMLGRMVFSQSLNPTGRPLSLSAVTGGDGCLSLCFDWAEEPGRNDTDGAETALHCVPKAMKGAIEKLVATTPQP